jgi:hypothetical protein
VAKSDGEERSSNSIRYDVIPGCPEINEIYSRCIGDIVNKREENCINNFQTNFKQ